MRYAKKKSFLILILSGCVPVIRHFPTAVYIVLLYGTIEAACFFKERLWRRLFYETYFTKVVQLNSACSTETFVTLHNVSLQG
jgi:hypothetical protein